MRYFNLKEKIYLISGSPLCPWVGLVGGEENIGNLSLSLSIDLDSFTQKINQLTAVALLVLLGYNSFIL